MKVDLNVVSVGKKGASQEVLGVMVTKIGVEFGFNYSTAIDPRPVDIELLKNFRNKFVDELEDLNKLLKDLPD